MYMQKTEGNEQTEENLPESSEEAEETTPVIEVEDAKEVEELEDEEPEEILTKEDLIEDYEKCDNCDSLELNLKNNIYTCANCGCRWTYEE